MKTFIIILLFWIVGYFISKLLARWAFVKTRNDSLINPVIWLIPFLNYLDGIINIIILIGYYIKAKDVKGNYIKKWKK